TGLDAKPDTRKIAVLLTVAGPQAIEVYNTFVFGEGEDKDKFEDVLKKFDAHCSPKKNETYERDSMIRDQIVFGVSDKKIRERLLREAELTLEGAIKEHNERLVKVLKSIRKNGLKLNKSKRQFAVQEIIFLGDKLTAQGIQPDQE
ncbi:hypothetical protein NFI96_028888, partial [Prochilodus magdalenae]